MNGFHTRSALVRHAERGLGIRHRPDFAHNIECVGNPIPQPESPWGTTPKSYDRDAITTAAAVLALVAFIVAILAIAQNLLVA